MNHRIEVPLPMSVNKMYVYNKYTHQKVYKKDAMDYLQNVSVYVKNQYKGPQLKDYTYLDMEFFMSRKNADSHNYKKLIFDMLQWAGVVEDDRYIMDRTQSIKIDTKNPRVIITWTTS